jgi:hypothetical protein
VIPGTTNTLVSPRLAAGGPADGFSSAPPGLAETTVGDGLSSARPGDGETTVGDGCDPSLPSDGETTVGDGLSSVRPGDGAATVGDWPAAADDETTVGEPADRAGGSAGSEGPAGRGGDGGVPPADGGVTPDGDSPDGVITVSARPGADGADAGRPAPGLPDAGGAGTADAAGRDFSCSRGGAGGAPAGVLTAGRTGSRPGSGGAAGTGPPDPGSPGP